ncbi:MAG: outer membrane protein assembly factor [Deltaproteobacteria bacterium]|nr:outer membrane protein assembly factor [Deltaproteobacteria bacterium]
MPQLPAFAGVKVSVVVEGVSGPLYANVLARLKIYLHRENERLGDREVRRLHRQAENDIRSALAPFGYYQPQITTGLIKEDEGWRALYIIEKGEPILVKKVECSIVGSGRNSEQLSAAVASFPLNHGDILDQSLYEKGKKQLINAALDEGFLEAGFVEQALRINIEDSNATVHLVIQTGPQYVFGQIRSEQKVLRPDLLRRYLPYKPGDPYNPSKLFELQSILYRTDYFSSVVAKGDTDHAVDLRIPVSIELTPPAHLNKYSVGLGYATDTGIRGKLDWKNRLFNSKGHKMSASLLVAQLENSFSLFYEIPRDNPRYETFIHGLTYQDQRWDDTNTRLITASVKRKYSGPRYLYSFGLELRDEVYDVGNTSGDSTLLIPSLNGGFIWADDILNTKNGLQASVGLLGSVDGVAADASFFQVTVGGKAIISPTEKFRLIGRGSLGATYVDSIDSLPPSLRFYTGGDSSIRGYKYKSIGTRDESGTVIGGRYLVVGSIEAERIVKDYWSVAGFWDVGSATDDLQLDFYQGIGVGVRIRLPFGQIRLDLASAITEDGNPLRLHLTVGGDL